jgi:hypothetical protein
MSMKYGTQLKLVKILFPKISEDMKSLISKEYCCALLVLNEINGHLRSHQPESCTERVCDASKKT